jgi:hypothetical protein
MVLDPSTVRIRDWAQEIPVRSNTNAVVNKIFRQEIPLTFSFTALPLLQKVATVLGCVV